MVGCAFRLDLGQSLGAARADQLCVVMHRDRAAQSVDGGTDSIEQRGTLLRLERDVIAVRSQLVKPSVARILLSPPIGAEPAGSK